MPQAFLIWVVSPMYLLLTVQADCRFPNSSSVRQSWAGVGCETQNPFGLNGMVYEISSRWGYGLFACERKGKPGYPRNLHARRRNDSGSSPGISSDV